MAELATLARPYAEAVFEIAKEENNFDSWSDQLEFLTALIKDPLMAQVIMNPRMTKADLESIVLGICEEKISTDLGKNLVKMLIENNRLNVVPQLAEQYEALKAEHLAYVQVDVISTYVVKSQQRQKIAAVLKKRLGKAVNINTTVDRDLIGGWLIRIGDQVIDLSIKGRLQQLANELRR